MCRATPLKSAQEDQVVVHAESQATPPTPQAPTHNPTLDFLHSLFKQQTPPDIVVVSFNWGP